MKAVILQADEHVPVTWWSTSEGMEEVERMLEWAYPDLRSHLELALVQRSRFGLFRVKHDARLVFSVVAGLAATAIIDVGEGDGVGLVAARSGQRIAEVIRERCS